LINVDAALGPDTVINASIMVLAQEWGGGSALDFGGVGLDISTWGVVNKGSSNIDS